MRKFLSLRVRLTLFTSAALILLLLIIVGILQSAIVDYMRGETDRQLDQRAGLVAELVHRQPTGGLTVPNLEDLSRNGWLIQVLDATGRLVASSENAGKMILPPPGPDNPPVMHRGRILLVAEREVREGDELIGRVRVASVPPNIGAATRTTHNVIVFIIVLGVPGAVVLAWFLSRQTVQPLEQLTETATAIAQSRDLSQRVGSGKRQDEVGRLAVAFNVMLDELQEADQEREEMVAAQRRFLADASHNLRTPLTIILGHLDLLRRIGDDPKAMVLAREEIEGEAKRMSRLVSDLLILVRADAGAEVPREPVLLGDVLADLTRRYAALNPDLWVTAAGLESLEGRAVPGHGPYLEQLFSLLLENACKYTPAGGTVTLAAAVVGERLSVRVVDTGIGIPAEALPRIFERFYRAPNAAAREGAGLGLAIALSVAHAHGGDMTVSSTEGQGSTFEVTLPLLG